MDKGGTAIYLTKLCEVKKELSLKHLTWPLKCIFYLLASHSGEARKTLKKKKKTHSLKTTSSLRRLPLTVPLSDALGQDRPRLGRQDPISAGWQQSTGQRPQAPVSALWEVSWQGENCMYFWKSFKSRARQPLC